MARPSASIRVADLASMAVWASLGAALVIHGCASDPVRPTSSRSSALGGSAAPKSVLTQSPPLAVAPVSPSPAPPAPVFEERPSIPTTEPDVRIRVAALRRSSPVVRLTNPSGKLLMQGPGLETRALRTPVDVRPAAGGWRVVEGAGSKRPVALDVTLAGSIEFHPPAGAHGVVTFDGSDWPGPMRVVKVDEAPDAIDVVVDVPLERYLPGVLAKELLASWDVQAFRAQAIAARSFAVCEHAHWSAVRHYDMVAGEASQAWVGVTKDPKPRDAVASTRGMLLTFEGKVVPAYYSSTCGGTPANAIDSLTRNPNHGIAPLSAGASMVAKPRDCCVSAPRFRWQQTFTNASICERVRRWANDQLDAQRERQEKFAATQLASVSPVTAPVASVPLQATAGVSPVTTETTPIGSNVSAKPAVKVESTATAIPLGARVDAITTKQNARTGIVDIADDAPLSSLAALTSIRSLEIIGSNPAGRPARMRITDAAGRSMEMRSEDFRRAVNYAREGEPTPKERINSSHFTSVVLQGNRIEFTGHGFGHGVGMCQYGAQSMARSGADALVILRTYYPGATVVRGY